MGDPVVRNVRGDDEASYAAPFEGFFYGGGQLVLRDPADLCLVLGRSLGEALDDLLSICVVLLAVAALEGDVLGAFVFWHVAGGGADAQEDRLLRARHYLAP